MSKLLDKAFEEASKLSDSEQEAFARWILDEIAAESGWRDRLTSSTSALSSLASEALAERKSGGTEPLDPDSL